MRGMERARTAAVDAADAIGRVTHPSAACAPGGPAPEASSAEGDGAGPAVHVAIVRDGRAIRFVAAARTRSAVIERLTDYVRSWAEYQLDRDHAVEVHRLLEAGLGAAAVERYFGTVGRRWDREWLSTHVVELAT